MQSQVPPNLFFRDDSPEAKPRRFLYADQKLDHIVYLHINGEFIWKHEGYIFSAGCMYYDGGMVAHIWPLHTSVNRVLAECGGSLENQRQGRSPRSGLDQFITQEGFDKFGETLRHAGWEFATSVGWHKDVWTDDD